MNDDEDSEFWCIYLILKYCTIWDFQLHPRFCIDTNFPLQNQTHHEAK